MFVTFVVIKNHELAKELAGGRVRVSEGETVSDALRRRIAQDTRCEIVSIRETPPDPERPHRSRQQFDLTLLSHGPRHGTSPRVPREGVIRVAI